MGNEVKALVLGFEHREKLFSIALRNGIYYSGALLLKMK